MLGPVFTYSNHCSCAFSLVTVKSKSGRVVLMIRPIVFTRNPIVWYEFISNIVLFRNDFRCLI